MKERLNSFVSNGFVYSLGLLYGAALGDAIGVATQGMTVDECQFHYDPTTLTYEDIIRDELRVRWRQGDWSDCFDQLVNLVFLKKLGSGLELVTLFHCNTPNWL